jgi:hypothetical protein
VHLVGIGIEHVADHVDARRVLELDATGRASAQACQKAAHDAKLNTEPRPDSGPVDLLGTARRAERRRQEAERAAAPPGRHGRSPWRPPSTAGSTHRS